MLEMHSKNDLISRSDAMEKKLWQLLMVVMDDPTAYIGEPNLERLDAFWNGMGIYLRMSEGKVFCKIPGFREFLDKKYPGSGGGHGFSQVIRLNCQNEREAFYRFNELLEEFLGIKGEDYRPMEPVDLKGQKLAFEGGVADIIWNLVNTRRTAKMAALSFGRCSIELLEAFINGARYCAECVNNTQTELLPGFDEYLGSKFRVQKEKTYYRIISEYSADDEEAFWNFYDWMYDFISEQEPDYEPVVERYHYPGEVRT